MTNKPSKSTPGVHFQRGIQEMIQNNPSHARSPQQLLMDIKESVSPYYASLDPWHNLDHGARVVAMALEINKIEGADPFLVEAGAWLHQYHRPNLDLLKPVLDSLPLKNEERTELFQIVSLCRPDLITSRPEHITDRVWKAAQVVYDGDALDLMGPSGLFREVLCNTAYRNKSHAEAITLARDVQNLFTGTIQTATAKALAQTMNEPLTAFWAAHDRHEEQIKHLGAPSY